MIKQKHNFRKNGIFGNWTYDTFYGKRHVNLHKYHHKITEIFMWDRYELSPHVLPALKWRLII